MELIKIFILILLGIIQNVKSKVDSYSQAILTGMSNSHLSQNEIVKEQIQTQMIEIYNDKVLTQKMISFDNVGYSMHQGTNNVVDGLVFDSSKSNNAGIANNYLSDKGSKKSDSQTLVRFTNFYKCEVFALNKPDLHYDIIQIGIVDTKGTVSYMSLSFGNQDKQDKKKLAEDILKSCKDYTDTLKKKMDEFYKEVQVYWKTKAQIQQLADQIKNFDKKNKVENDQLAQVLTDKKNFEKNINETQSNLNKTKLEMDQISKKLKSEYKNLNDLKERKSNNEKNLSSLNTTLNGLANETKTVQARLDKANQESDEMRARSDELISNIKDVKDSMYGVEKNLTDEREVEKELIKNIDKINKKINENGKHIARFNKDIKVNKDFLDKIALEDLPNAVNKTKQVVEKYEKASLKTMNETNSTDSDILQSNRTINETMSNLTELIAKPHVMDSAKKGRIKNNIKKGKAIFDTFRKIFPILPDVYMNNMWNFLSLNHYEAMNYIQGVKPSYFSLYDHVFGPNDPKRQMDSAKKMNKKN